MPLLSGTSTPIGTPASLANRLYADNSDRTKSVWISQGALSVYDNATGKDLERVKLSGITYPVQWLSADAVLYRLSTASETADYALSTVSGTPHKVADVVATYGLAHAQ